MRLGKKAREWARARERLEEEYLRNGITKCEWCGSTYALSFHHLDKRSSGRAEHTFEGTRLLCPACHEKAEYNKEFNELLRKLR